MRGGVCKGFGLQIEVDARLGRDVCFKCVMVLRGKYTGKWSETEYGSNMSNEMLDVSTV